MKRLNFVLFILLLQSGFLFSQVAINADGSAPHESAGLDISYPDKGFLLPRLTVEQRNSIPNPAEGLIIYCTNCSNEGTGALSVFQGGSWKMVNLTCILPDAPSNAASVPTTAQITWNWIACPLATGYKWNTANDYASATDMGTATTYTEAGLVCWTEYTRYVWSYNDCGHSPALAMIQSTLDIPFSTPPTAGTHSSTAYSISWNWNAVSGATGYMWNTINDVNSAIDLGAGTSYNESGLLCNTGYTRYVWAYNACGVSTATTITKSTLNNAPVNPSEATHDITVNQIVWNWSAVPGAAGYKWNTVNEFNSAQDLGLATSKAETGLSCNTPYTRFVWAYNNCGYSTAGVLSETTASETQASPVPAINTTAATNIIWKWHPLPGQTSNYKWNSTNDYNTAIDLLTDTAYTETGLTCNTSYTRYIWAYDACGISSPVNLSAITSLDPPVTPGEAIHIPSASQIVWKWNQVAGAAGYKWNTVNDPGTALAVGTATEYTESGLTCNTNYTRYVWAYTNCGTSDATTLSQMSSLDPPDAPGAAVHESYPNMIVWNWSPVSGAQGYKWSTSNNYGSAIEMGASTTKIESGLTCNTNYTRYVWAYGTCGVSDAAVLVQTSALDPPQSPNAGTHQPSPSQIVWNWFGVTGATGYKWNTTNDYGSAQDMGPAITKTETGLDCNTNYTRYIWSYSNCGHSAAVSLVQTTALNPPAAPVAAAHVPSPTQVIWNWSPVSGAAGYKWNSTNNISTATDLGLNTTKTETGLTCNTPYIRYVWAYSNCGTSTATSLSQTTSLDPPAAPVAATHVAAPAQIIWNWNAVTGATGYKWNTSNDLSTAQDLGAALTKTETGLNCNTAYSRYVWAYSNCGTSTPVTLTKTTTTETPATPTTGTHVASNTQVIWNWNAVTGATGYKWNTVNDYATAVNMGTATSNTENNLTCGTNYNRYVWSYNNCASSVPVVLTQTTASNPPSAPVAGTHTATANQIVWNWNAVSGATSYKWNTTNDIATATDISNVTSKTENSLSCNTSYTRYIWAFNGCASSTSTTLTRSTTQDPPVAPTSGNHDAYPSQIVWHWNTVSGADGYKWNNVNNYATATDMGAATAKTETGLSCATSYIRYAWAYNSCGVSTSVMLAQTTTTDPPTAPAEGTHVSTPDQITWNWNPVTGAAGYKWNTTNDYGTAIDMGTSTTKTENGLSCATSYTRYVWAYHSCGTSASTSLNQAAGACFVCGTTLNISHVAGNVAPVSKTTTYGTVNNVPGETSKCWITSNLGSDHQASSVSDNTEASAGWYWQFNRTQGFKHDGTTRTPNTTWIANIDEYANWTTANDPCALELGTGWRLPTSTEYNNIDAGGSWTNWNGPWNSVLKMHASGRLDYYTGNLDSRGSKGFFWSGTQTTATYMGHDLNFAYNSCSIGSHQKSFGFSIRCLRE